MSEPKKSNLRAVAIFAAAGVIALAVIWVWDMLPYVNSGLSAR